jgi:23S rRNA pseudouridine2605 synthase
MQERLQKIIARAGVTSRRSAEELILAGRVRVNGSIVTELGKKADPFADKIEVDGKRLVAEDPVYVVLHKPRNVVATMSDPEGRPTVAELLKGVSGRVYPVGRLDFATSGVLLATNDGEFANGLLHPRKAVPKTYVVKALGVMGPADLDVWRKGVELEDGRTLPADVRFLRHEDDKTWFEITLREGRNQQIRRMGEATGFRVGRLARLSFANVTSEGLRPGQWRHLSRDELIALREAYGVPRRVKAASGQVMGVVGRPVRASRSGPRDGRAHADPDREANGPQGAKPPKPRARPGTVEERVRTTHDRTTPSARPRRDEPARGGARSRPASPRSTEGKGTPARSDRGARRPPRR